MNGNLGSCVVCHERIFNLLSETFTLAEVQQVFEEILESELTKQNFRRKMMEFLVETDEIETGYSHRNSKKFKRKRVIRTKKEGKYL